MSGSSGSNNAMAFCKRVPSRHENPNAGAIKTTRVTSLRFCTIQAASVPPAGESANVNLLSEAAGYVHTRVRAIPEFFGFERREIFNLTIRHTVPRQSEDQHIVPISKKICPSSRNCCGQFVKPWKKKTALSVRIPCVNKIEGQTGLRSDPSIF